MAVIEDNDIVPSDTFDDFWEWDPDTGEWEEQVCGEQCQRTMHSMAYDPLRNKAVVFGGVSVFSEEHEVYNDLWELDIESETWSEKVSSFLKPNLPISGQGGLLISTAYDSDRDVIILSGRQDDKIEVWEWNNKSRDWKHRPTEGVRPDYLDSYNMKMAYDPDRKKCVLFGNYSNIWEWDTEVGEWTERVSPEPKADPRIGFSMVYDPVRKKTIIYGGYYADFKNDLWELDGQNGTWTERTEAGIKPQVRGHASMVYDRDRNKVMLVGGLSLDTGGSGTWSPLPELWEYDFGFNFRPAHIIQTFFSDLKAENSVEITSVATKFYSGGTGQLNGNEKNGAELKLWRNGRWEKLAENTVSPDDLSNNPENGLLEWVNNEISQLKTLFYGSSKTLSFAVTPIAPSGEENGVIATDYVEVVVNYRIEE